MIENFSSSKKRLKTHEKTNLAKDVLFPKKFVTENDLIIIFSVCLLCFLAHLNYIWNLPLYLIFLVDLPMLLIVWHRTYQILFDIKLLFFNRSFDSKVEYYERKKLPAITFIIPSCREPFHVAKMTFDSIVSTPYDGEKEIIVVDNSSDVGTDDFIKWKNYVESFNTINLSENLSAKFLYNEDKGTLKPGNLDLGQKNIEKGEFVVFLDVDSTLPNKGILLKQSIAEFESDSKLGFIQFRIKASNNHFNALTQGIAVSQDLLRLRMISRGYGGYKIFEGHNGIWRRSLLDELGSWTEYFRGNIIITEDILKSAHAYSSGYYGKPLNLETGEWVPSSLLALESMWMRWMYGNSQVFFKSFKKIYSKKISLLQKIDISYHMMHHLVTICFLIIAFLVQMLVPGPMTNVFIFSFGILPQLISALISYFTSVRKMELPMIQKIQNIYSGFFMIETFIMFIQIKSDFKFILGIRQGWKVTEKGVEDSYGLKALFLNNLFYFGMVVLVFGVCILSWIINYDMDFNAIHYHFSLLFIDVNLLLCLLFYRKQGRKLHNIAELAVIESCDLNMSSESEFTEATA